jgi:GTP cyclohydrolase I
MDDLQTSLKQCIWNSFLESFCENSESDKAENTLTRVKTQYLFWATGVQRSGRVQVGSRDQIKNSLVVHTNVTLCGLR